MTEDLRAEVERHAREAEQVWGNAYRRFDTIIDERQLRTGIELGVAFGGHVEALAGLPSVEKIYGVDPYEHRPDYDDPINVSQEQFDAIHDFVIRRMKVFGTKYEHLRTYSLRAAVQMHATLDFIYIDAEHSYKGVSEDLVAWFGKIRDGGIVGGHDYGHVDFPGVKQAVDEFFSRFDWRVHEEGEGVWWVEKKPIHITFILPAFNCERTLEASVDSLFNGNTEDGDEVIIADDSSADNTASVIESLRLKYPDIRIVRHRNHRGAGSARNTAIENSSHQLLFALDPDSILEKGSVPRLKHFLVNSMANAATFQEIRFFRKDIEKIEKRIAFEKVSYGLADHLSDLVSPGAYGNYLFTVRSWLKAGGFPDTDEPLALWGFALRQHAMGFRISVLQEGCIFGRVGSDHAAVSGVKELETSLKALQLVLPYVELLNERDVRYILRKRNRRTWFSRLQKHPLRVRNLSGNKKRNAGFSINQQSVRSFLRRIIRTHARLGQVVLRLRTLAKTKK